MVHSALGNMVLADIRQLGKKAIEVNSTEIPTEGSFTNKQPPGLPLLKHHLDEMHPNFSDQDKVHCLNGRGGQVRVYTGFVSSPKDPSVLLTVGGEIPHRQRDAVRSHFHTEALLVQ